MIGSFLPDVLRYFLYFCFVYADVELRAQNYTLNGVRSGMNLTIVTNISLLS